jgi:ABC-type Mn2+/Zn2+ transport system permease subunit
VDTSFLEGMRERARRQLAQSLVFILAGIIGLAFVAAGAILAQSFWMPPGVESARLTAEADLLLRVLELVFGPVVALVGGALGYYFATKERLQGR